MGGEVLFIEASRMSGTASLTLTGQLGDVMKESARAALSWVRAHAAQWSIDPDFFKSSEIHVHVPSGAIPKDGPSAGVTMATALVSELSRRPVRGDVAMTGEITLSGKVLPVGGIKEKVLAAKRAGVREIILPRQNEKNVKEDLDADLRAGLTIHLVGTIDEVLLLALVPVRPPAAKRAAAARAGVDAVAPRRPGSGVRVVYSPRYHLDFGAHVFPTEKYRRVADRVARAGLVPAGFVEPVPAGVGRAGAGPHRRLPRRARATARSRPTTWRGSRFPCTPAIVEGFRLMTGGTITAARLALDGRDRVAVHIGGGFHHAFAGHGEGFCMFNDVAVAIREAQRARRAGRAAVVDLDVHQGNGTASIFAGDPRVFTLSVHEQANYPPVKPPGSLDIGLAARHRRRRLPGGARRRAGPRARAPARRALLPGRGRPYADDQLGGLAAVAGRPAPARPPGVRGRRDRPGVPIVVLLAGGYARQRRRHGRDPRRHDRGGGAGVRPGGSGQQRQAGHGLHVGDLAARRSSGAPRRARTSCGSITSSSSWRAVESGAGARQIEAAVERHRLVAESRRRQQPAEQLQPSGHQPDLLLALARGAGRSASPAASVPAGSSHRYWSTA